MQLIYVIKAQGTNHFRVHWVLYQLENLKLWRELAATGMTGGYAIIVLDIFDFVISCFLPIAIDAIYLVIMVVFNIIPYFHVSNCALIST